MAENANNMPRLRMHGPAHHTFIISSNPAIVAPSSFSPPRQPATRLTGALLALVLAALPTPGAAQGSTPGAGSLACLILPERVADLGNQVAGVVDTIEVERGDMVKKGQVVARMRADVERANTGVARSRADSEADLRGAIAARDLAQLKLDRAKKLAQQSFVSAQAVEQADSEFRVADEKVSLAREQLGTSQREVVMSQAQLSQRVLRAPFDGIVIERYANPGERYEDKPMLKIASITQLRVEVVASTALFGSLQLGQELTVQPDLPGTPPRTARIAQIDRVLDPASNTFRVRLDLPNADSSLPAGLRCKIDLGKNARATDAARATDKPLAGAAAPRTAPGSTLLTQVEAQRPPR